MPPSQTPLGLLLAQTAKAVTRAFEGELTAAGGSVPTWLVLISLMEAPLVHSELARRIGIRGPTLTHHLDRMAEQGLIERERSVENKRIQWTRITPAGRALFQRLRKAAEAHDARLHGAIPEADAAHLRRALAALSRAFLRT